MTSHHSPLLAVGLLVCFFAACDGHDPDEVGDGVGRQGGSITVAQTSQPDFLDPALSYSVNSWEPMWLVYTPPITYRRAEGREGTELVPGLADALPEISADGKTVRFRFRAGLRFSDGTLLRASDFEHTVKRVLRLESGGSAFYLGIVGAQEYVQADNATADISGIESDNATREVVVRLTERDGTILNVLAMNFAGLVPGDTPFENMTKNPPPGIGPYKITESRPNRQFVLERNRGFKIPGIPGGKVDRITTSIIPSTQRQAVMVMRGELDYMQDPPPPDLLAEIRTKYADRFAEHSTTTTYYFFMNVRAPPFDRIEVRRAVNYALDSRVLVRLFGGRLEPSCNFLPWNLVGYEEIDPCPYGNPRGPADLNRARELVEAAGASGARVKVWTNSQPLASYVGAYLEDMLEQIGLAPKLVTISPAVYFQTLGNLGTDAQIGFANWYQDFPHPANFLFLVDGDSIQPTNNQNLGNVDDAELNRLIDRVERATPEEAADVAAAADRRIVEQAYVAPYGSERVSTFLSERMDFDDCSLFHPVYQNDYSSFCLKSPP